MTPYFKKDDISSILGAINSLTASLEQHKTTKDFEKLAYLIKDHPRSRQWITAPIINVVYNLYCSNSEWFPLLEWLFEMKVPITRRGNDPPLSFLVAMDDEKSVLFLFNKYGYDINERFLLKSDGSYVSIYNFLDPDSDSVPLIYEGGWRPVSCNYPTDLATIILREQLSREQIGEIWGYYFTESDPNRANILDTFDWLGKSNLLFYLCRRWTTQDKRILLTLLEDPRWSYDSIRYAIFINKDLKGLMGEELVKHNDRAMLFEGKSDMKEFLDTHRNRCQAGYCYLLGLLGKKEEHMFTSDEAYEWMDVRWASCVADYLPYDIDIAVLFHPEFPKRYLKGLRKWMEHKGYPKTQASIELNMGIHQSLCIQMNVIAWVHANFWFSNWRLRELYEYVL